MGYVRKTLRKEHDTPKRSRFRCLVEQGLSQAEAARQVGVNRKTAIKWLYHRPSDRRTSTGKRTGRPSIISDEKVKEIIKWMTGHFERRAMPLQKIADIHDIKATDKTILATFARHGYHYHMPDCKPFLTHEHKLQRYAFTIANWDRTKEYWRRGFYYDESTVQSTLRRRLKILRK
jgi:transposase